MMWLRIFLFLSKSMSGRGSSLYACELLNAERSQPFIFCGIFLQHCQALVSDCFLARLSDSLSAAICPGTSRLDEDSPVLHLAVPVRPVLSFRANAASGVAQVMKNFLNASSSLSAMRINNLLSEYDGSVTNEVRFDSNDETCNTIKNIAS